MRRISLSVKILLLALLNLLFLAFVFFVFARLQFRFELSSFLSRQVRERVLSVSRELALQLPETTPEGWNKLLAGYSSRYPAELYLFNADGQEQMADEMPGAPESIKGFLLAVYDCCEAKASEFNIPNLILDEVSRRAAVDPAKRCASETATAHQTFDRQLECSRGGR